MKHLIFSALIGAIAGIGFQSHSGDHNGGNTPESHARHHATVKKAIAKKKAAAENKKMNYILENYQEAAERARQAQIRAQQAKNLAINELLDSSERLRRLSSSNEHKKNPNWAPYALHAINMQKFLTASKEHPRCPPVIQPLKKPAKETPKAPFLPWTGSSGRR